jgi:hypothetical protein
MANLSADECRRLRLAKRWRRIAAARIAWAEFILGKGE